MNNLNLLFAKLDGIFCSTNSRYPQNKNKGIIKLEKEKCRCFLVFLMLAWILELIICISKLISYPFWSFLFFSFTNIIFLCILHKQKILVLDIMAISFLAIIGFIYSEIFLSSEHLIALQIIYSIFPSFALLLTRSFSGSIFVHITNLFHSCYSYSQIDNIHFACFRQDINQFPLIIILSSGIGFILLEVFWIILESRKKIIMELHTQYDQVEKINVMLSKSNKELMKTLESSKNLLLSVSHEIRNPLNIISGSANLLFDMDKNKRNHIETIKITCNLLNYLVSNLLFDAKLETNQLEIFKKSINMQTFLANVWNTSKILIRKKKIEGHMLISKNMPPQLDIDSIRILQIIYNIISNSVKFTKEGYIGLIVTWFDGSETDESLFSCADEDSFRQFLYSKRYMKIKGSPKEITGINLYEKRYNEELDQEGKSFFSKEFLPYLSVKRVKTFGYRNLFDKYYDISFNNESFPEIINNRTPQIFSGTTIVGFLKVQAIDSGCGISEEDKNKLFQKFTQVGAEKNKVFGSGLGLWIIKNLCIKMGGDMQVNSRVDQGSVFTATIKCF